MSPRAIFTDAATLRVRCPTCGAGPGEPCRTEGRRRRRSEAHATRERALRKERARLIELQKAAQGSLFPDPRGSK